MSAGKRTIRPRSRATLRRGKQDRRSSQPASPARPRPILKWSLISGLLVTLTGLLAAFLYWQSLYQDMPELPETTELWNLKREPAIEFIDQQGETLAIRGPHYGRAIRLADLPAHVPRAFIASEDKRFYQHDGADTQAMMRALWSNLSSGRTVSGASTLTQQLVKNLVLSPEQSLRRKVQEIRLARQLEKKLSKDEILELYLNRVYLGSGYYGLGAASRFYFGKDPEDLTLAEASLLATLPKAPSRLALDNNIAGARQRQRYVLAEMVQSGFIPLKSAEIALSEKIKLAQPADRDPQFGYILDTAQARAKAILPDAPDDLVIRLTIDASVQRRIVSAINNRMESEGPQAEASQSAALILDRTGRVVALYGGRDYQENQFNRVVQARRQPGSAFKPFVYAAALKKGLSPYDVRIDEPISIGSWSPNNFSRTYIGPVTIAESLQNSLNTIAARLGQEAGLEAVIKLAKNFGFETHLKPYPSLTLGSQEVTLWELTGAYGPFMTGGRRLDPFLIQSIENSRGDIVYEHAPAEAAIVYPGDMARQMTGMMAWVVAYGTGQTARMASWKVAGKTGTSQSSRDAWFIGYTALYLGGVWTGNDDDSPMKDVTGGGLPASLWSDIMRIVHEEHPPEPLIGADSLTRLTKEQEERVRYYRSLSFAFSGLIKSP